MNESFSQKILDRSKRIRQRMDTKSGLGVEWEATTFNGEIHEYVINGVKPPEEFEDDIESAFVWLWSFKDYIKQYSISKGMPSNWIELKVNNDQSLCTCADIANKAKHGNLLKSRSGKYPKLGKLKYVFPHNTITEITFYSHKVEMGVKPDGAQLAMNIIDQKGNILGDAFELIDSSLQAWERIIEELDDIT